MTKAVQAAKRGRGVSPIYLDEDDQPEQSNVIYMRGRRRRRIVFGWYGGKFSHLDWLLPLLPKCHHYCEPFAGSGAVLINREAAPVETYNDIDGDVVNFFRVLRDRHEELIRAIALTPFSREEYHRAIYGSTSGISDVERARRFYIKARQTRTGLAQTASLGRWANCKDTSRAGMSGVVSRWLGGVDALDEIAQRLIRVQIENRPAVDVIRLYDSPKTLFYCDPPYMGTEKYYQAAFSTADHERLARVLHNIRGRFLLSYNDCEAVRKLYEDCEITPLVRRNNLPSVSTGEFHEVLISNYTKSQGNA